MLELVKAGGRPMIPLLLPAVTALAIVVERFLKTPGPIAVAGMAQRFLGMPGPDQGHANRLAGGIGKALARTATGMLAALAAPLFHRCFRGRLPGVVNEMEPQAMALVAAGSAQW